MTNMSDMSDDTEGQVDAGGWLTVPQAALYYRKSTKTIERWADAGKLQRHPTARPVEVWVAAAPGGDRVSDMSDDTVGPEERTVALAERLSVAVGRQVSPTLALLERSEERGRMLERENGTLVERVAGLERELDSVRQVSATDRERLTVELAAARTALADLRDGQLVSQAETIGRQAAELEAMRAPPATLGSSGAPEPDEPPSALGPRPEPFPWPPPPTPNWRTWWRWLVAAALLAVMVGLLAWPR